MCRAQPPPTSIKTTLEKRASDRASPVVGVFGNGLPPALLAAASVLSRDVKSAPDDRLAWVVPEVDAILEPVIDDFARVFLHRFTAGDFAAFKAIVFPRSDAAAHTAYLYASELLRQRERPEMGDLIALLERLTGRSFDRGEFKAYLDAINAQEEIFGEVSDMLAATPRVPVRFNEQIPNVMIPQWHRGSPWALAHARSFRDEVADRIGSGLAVCPDERIRMMWIAAGLWFDTGFYSAFEESHGAVFAWSMYLPFARDGYVRYDHGDPLRALAARVVSMKGSTRLPGRIVRWAH